MNRTPLRSRSRPNRDGAWGPARAGSFAPGDATAWSTLATTFDGVDDYADLGTGAELNPEDVTISMWIKPDALTNYDYLFTRGSADYHEAYRLEIGASVLFCAFGNGSSNGWISRSHGMSNGNWYHVAVTYDGATAALYVDGARLGATESISIVMEQATRNSYIAKPLGTGAYFDGTVDEVALWSTALSAANIAGIYGGGKPRDLAYLNPVGWWRMGDDDGGAGTTITDQGSGGNNGTLTNGPTFTLDTPKL